MQPKQISKWPESQFRVTDEQRRLWETRRKSSKVDNTIVDSTIGPGLLQIPPAFSPRLRDPLILSAIRAENLRGRLSDFQLSTFVGTTLYVLLRRRDSANFAQARE
jgi:hypothetical protein